MVQRDFDRVEGPKAEGFSEPQLHEGVHALNHAGVVLSPSAEPVENQLPVVPQADLISARRTLSRAGALPRSNKRLSV